MAWIREQGVFFVVDDFDPETRTWGIETPWYCSPYGDVRLEVGEEGHQTELDLERGIESRWNKGSCSISGHTFEVTKECLEAMRDGPGGRMVEV